MLEVAGLKEKVEPIIKEAGDILLSYFKKARTLKRQKKDGAGFVTEADLASEKLLIEKLSQVVPGADFFAEESGISGNAEYRWVIDPLDGTTNFAHGFPHFCISVALANKERVLFGMIYQPVLQELFWAQAKKGAWLNGDRLQISTPKEFGEGFLVVSFPYRHSKNGSRETCRKILAHVEKKAFSFRHLGSAALDFASVASGRFDGLFAVGLDWWDFAAGGLMIEEAGGKATTFEGKKLKSDSKTFVAGGALMHETIAKLARECETAV